MRKRYIFTKHLRERYCERFLNLKPQKAIEEHIMFSGPDLDKELNRRLLQASNEKSIHNTKYGLYYIEKYCMDVKKEKFLDKSINFLQDGDIIFVIVKEKINLVVTCFESKGFRGSQKHKYKKKNSDK